VCVIGLKMLIAIYSDKYVFKRVFARLRLTPPTLGPKSFPCCVVPVADGVLSHAPSRLSEILVLIAGRRRTDR
jgi:hypothetical protein